MRGMQIVDRRAAIAQKGKRLARNSLAHFLAACFPVRRGTCKFGQAKTPAPPTLVNACCAEVGQAFPPARCGGISEAVVGRRKRLPHQPSQMLAAPRYDGIPKIISPR